LLREVVLGDVEATRATQHGTRIGGARHVMLSVGIAVAVVLITGFTWSFVANQRLVRTTRERAAAVQALAAGTDLPTLATLQTLDSLRTVVAPLHMRWGLSASDDLFRKTRPLYFAAFQRVMFSSTRAGLIDALRRLPSEPSPTDDYGAAYNTLKAYVIVTKEPRQSTRDFLAPMLQQYWLHGQQLDPDRARLASLQFDLYATELAQEDVFAETVDNATLERSRDYLKKFTGAEPIYQQLLAAAGKANPPIQFARQFPVASQVMNVPTEVKGAFTKGGWDFMQKAFAQLSRYLDGERWVLGNQDAAPIDKEKVAAELRDRYTKEYVQAWRVFLQTATVQAFGDVRDAARRLSILSSNQSPLLQLLAITSQNTHVSPKIDSLFQPVQSLTPPATTDKLIGPTNEPYMKVLGQLQAALEQTAMAQGAAQNQAAEQASSVAAQAKATTAQIAQQFAVDQQGQVDATVRRLLEAPINYAGVKVNRFGADKLNAAAGSFCSRANTFLRSFPFAPDGPQTMTVADFTTFLKPGTGQLWSFYNQTLQQVLQKQGSIYVGAGDTKVSPAFVTFFNRAAQLSDALFSEDQTISRITFEAEPLVPDGGSMATIVLDGQSVVAGQNQARRKFTWPGSTGESRISARVRGTDIESVNSFTGPWSVVQLLYAAEWRPEGNGYRLEWRTTARNADGTPLKLATRITPAVPMPGTTTASLSNIYALFHRQSVQGASCPSDIAQ
jgi:type VI secretion system protein ImpL